jgi:hypothetical protein
MSDWAKHANTVPAAPAAPPAVRPSAAPKAVQHQALPTSLYEAPHTQPAAEIAPPPKLAPEPYHPVRPTGEVVTLSLADLPPPGPSLERQQAAEEDAQVLAAQIARANAQAAQDHAAGKPVPNSTTELLGGPQ